MSEQYIGSKLHPMITWRTNRIVYLMKLQAECGLDFSDMIHSLLIEVSFLEVSIGNSK
jgi:hypothetical protein